jgi:hypothetical protein
MGGNIQPCFIEFDMCDASMLPECCPFDPDKEPNWIDAPQNTKVDLQTATNSAMLQGLKPHAGGTGTSA